MTFFSKVQTKIFPKINYYEAVVMYKPVPKDELIPMVKRSAMSVFEKDGFFRNMYFMGLNNTPVRISKNQKPYWKANYFMYEIHMPKSFLPDLFSEFERDVDIIHHAFIRQENEEIDYDKCTFEEEMRPVPYRPSTQKLLKITDEYKEKVHRRRWKPKMNLDFYPFQR